MKTIVNFVAFCLPLILFTYWGIIGYAVLSMLRSQRNILQNLLIAPSIGMAIMLLPVFWLNRIGFPISKFAMPLFVFYLLTSITILWIRKPLFPIKIYLPFVGLFLIALFITGGPLLRYGFSWISYGNDDMTNYSLGALRFLQHGFFDLPNLTDMIEGKDFTAFQWLKKVPTLERPGNEILIAWLSSIMHLSPIQVFMPLILTFHLMLISATGALACVSRYKKRVAFAACLLLVFSALTTLGTLYQLIAQVGGLSLLIVSTLLILQPFTAHKKHNTLHQGILIALTASALLVVYSELSPFLCLGFVFYFCISIIKGWRINKSFCLSLGIAALLICLFLNTQLVAVVQFVLEQAIRSATYSARSSQITLIFPYYLIPSGLAAQWGLQAISISPREPIMSLTILAGAGLTLAIIILSIRLVLRNVAPYAVMTLIMICLGINLFTKDLGFGLFKLVMYIQPFVACVIAISLFQLINRSIVRAATLSLCIFSNLSALSFYSLRSLSLNPGSFSEIAYGSTTDINKEYIKLTSNLPPNTTVFSDTFNSSILKLQALNTQHKSFIPLIASTIYGGFTRNLLQNNPLSNLSTKLFYINESAQLTKQYIKERHKLAHFDLLDEKQSTLEFYQHANPTFDNRLTKNDGVLIADSPLRSVINRQHEPFSLQKNFILKNLDQVENHLVFTDSDQGGIYGSLLLEAPYKHITLALFNIENDPMYTDHTMQSIGRYTMYRIIHPTPHFRLVLSLTNTFDGNANNQLPPASIIGATRTPLPLIGRGSARVFSSPLTPQLINSIPYIALDMNRDSRLIPVKRNGLMRVYGKQISLDMRTMASYTRNISVISEEDYQKLNPPTYLSHFPKDLYNNQLAYSGIYEDGWISENAFFELKQLTQNSNLIVKGMLPNIDDSITECTVSIKLNEEKLVSKKIKPGDFEIIMPVSAPQAGNRKIEIYFDKHQQLPRGDDRPAVALIKFIGFSETPHETMAANIVKPTMHDKLHAVLHKIKQILLKSKWLS